MILKNLLMAVCCVYTAHASSGDMGLPDAGPGELTSFPPFQEKTFEAIGRVRHGTETSQQDWIGMLVDIPDKPEWAGRTVLSKTSFFQQSSSQSPSDTYVFTLGKGADARSYSIIERYLAPDVAYEPWWTLGLVDFICHIDMCIVVLEESVKGVTPLQMRLDLITLPHGLKEGTLGIVTPFQEGAPLYYSRARRSETMAVEPGAPLALTSKHTGMHVIGILDRKTLKEDIFLSLAGAKSWINSL